LRIGGVVVCVTIIVVLVALVVGDFELPNGWALSTAVGETVVAGNTAWPVAG
jgi:hypothetical protein